MRHEVARRGRDVGPRASVRSRRPWVGSVCGICAVAAAVLLLHRGDVAAQEGSDDREARSCIDLNQIDHTDVVDDDTILFHMRGRDVYENDLPMRCPQLRSEDRFMYRVSTAQLCNLDTITVLNDMGFGFMPGATCGLGKFAPISGETAEQLLQTARDKRR